MADIRRDTGVPTSDKGVQQAQSQVTMLEGQLGTLGREAALLGASNIPVVGTVFDVGQGLWNAWNGRWADAALDLAGVVPGGGDAAKTAVRGTRIAKAVARVGKQLDAAKAALSRARSLARTRAAATRYWKSIKRKRDQIIRDSKKCKKGNCAKKRDEELGKLSRLPKTGGKWVDKNGNPVPAGSGYWKPDDDTPLAKALAKHPNGDRGVPFNDGKPDFSGFPAPGAKGHDPTVQIEMSGSSSSDISAASRAFKDRTGISTTGRSSGRDRSGTWHHEPDGVTMRYVDKDVHTAYQKADGTANSGTPHSGGDSMTRDPLF